MIPDDYSRSDRDLLIRLTTKFESMEDKFEGITDHLKSMERKFEDALKSIREDAEEKYMKKEHFKPYQDLLDAIRKKVTAAIVSGVVAACLALGAFPLYYSAFNAVKATNAVALLQQSQQQSVNNQNQMQNNQNQVQNQIQQSANNVK